MKSDVLFLQFTRNTAHNSVEPPLIQEFFDGDLFDDLEQQVRLLELQRKHLDGLISHARQILKTGVMEMNFSAFDTAEMDQHAAQAKEKWGQTDAYREFEQKTAGQTKQQLQAFGDELMDIFRQFGAIRQLSPASGEAQTLTAKLQGFITVHYYTCTKQILRNLGQMYVAGGSMTENIDKAGGTGTAEFVHQAIEIYCK